VAEVIFNSPHCWWSPVRWREYFLPPENWIEKFQLPLPGF